MARVYDQAGTILDAALKLGKAETVIEPAEAAKRLEAAKRKLPADLGSIA
jgi:hypothetical protein